MATKKFAGPSPYTLPKEPFPSDYLHAIYEANITAAHANKPSAPPVKAAIFGLGRAGSIHFASLAANPRAVLRYVVEEDTARWPGLKKHWKFGDDVTFLQFKDADKVFKDASINVVVVCSPTFTHEEIVTKALNSDKHVFCEKPIAEDISTTKKLMEQAKSKGKALFSAFNRRFDPSYRSLKAKIREGALGHVQILKVTARDSPLPTIDYLKTSGGVFHDCLIHDLDMSCWVLGELPVKVQATASALIPEIKAIDDFDTIAFLLTFPSGAIAIGDNSRYSVYGYDQRLEVFGPKGMIKLENERPCPSLEFVLGKDGEKKNPIYYSFPSRFRLAYQNEMEHFLDIVQFGVEPEVKNWQNLAVSKIATAAEESARTGKTVELDWTKDNIPADYS